MAHEPDADRPLVSVALAAYNGERFLPQQLDSILQQTYRPLEIVASDDCSADATWTILCDYARRYPRLVRCARNASNLGCTGNFAKAMSLCTGAFVALSDQDDLWHPGKIERLVAAIGDADLVHSDARIVDENGELVHSSLRRYSALPVTRRGFGDVLACNIVTGCTAMVRRSLVRRAQPFPGSIPHDMWLALAAADGKGIRYVKDPLLDYRQHDANAIGAHAAEGARGLRVAAGTTWTGFLARQQELYRRNRDNLRRIAQESGAALTPAGFAHLRDQTEYYSSYFEKRLRLRAFLYYARHFRSMRGKKTVLRGVVDLVLSLVGEGSERGRA